MAESPEPDRAAGPAPAEAKPAEPTPADSWLAQRCRELEDTVARLEARHEALAVALAVSSLGTFRWSIATDEVFWDGGLRQVFGLAPDQEVHGIKDFLAFVHPEDQAMVQATVEHCLALGHDARMDFRIVRPDGSVRWIEDRARLVKDAAGRPAWLIGACMDVTSRKEVEQRLRDSEERYRALVETSPDAVYVHVDGTIILANRQAAALLGAATPDLLVGRSAYAIVAPESLELARLRVGRLRVAGVRNEPVLLIFQRLDGRKIRVEVAAAAVMVDGRLAIQVTLRDLAEREVTEQALRERDEILALAERSAQIGIWDIDLATRLVRGTPQFFRLYGLPPTAEPVPLEQLRALRHPDDQKRVIERFEEALAGGTESYETEYRIIRPDGRLRWIMGRGRVIRDPYRRPLRYTGIDIDITDRRRAEERQRLLFAELGHRVKNMLAVVQSIADRSFTGGRSLDEARAVFVDRLQALARTQDLLTATSWQGASLPVLVERELAPYGRRAGQHGPELLLTAKATQMLGLVLHELATNAAKYGALSGPLGRVEVSWEVTPGQTLRLSWREQGGPPVRAPDQKGFGCRLIEQAAAHDLGGRAQLAFAPEGVTYELLAELAAIAGQEAEES